MNQLHFALLGAPEVRRDARPLRFRSRKVLALLVYLAVSGGKHSRRQLASLFWPDSDAQRGHAALRNTLRHLREALSDGEHDQPKYLVADDDSLFFDGSAGTIFDLHAVDTAYHLVQTVPLASDVRGETRSRQLMRLQAAVESYSGEFLQDFELEDAPAFEDWVRERREAWRERIDLIFEHLAEMRLDGGEVVAAQQIIKQWIAHNPLHEGARRRLMQAHAIAGDRVAALQAYDTWRTFL